MLSVSLFRSMSTTIHAIAPKAVPTAQSILNIKLHELFEGHSQKKVDVVLKSTMVAINDFCSPLTLEEYELKCGTEAVNHLFLNYGLKIMQTNFVKEVID